MTDFLGRLAARAVGQASTAQPRLASRFEDPVDGAPGDGSLEFDETELIASPAEASPAASDSGPTSTNDRARADIGILERSTGAPAAQSGQRRGEAAAHAVERRLPVLVAEGVDTVPRASSPLVASVASDEVVVAATPPEASPLVAASIVVSPGAVSHATARNRPNELGRSIGTPSPEPPIVRVHIGRLDIRANLPEPKPARSTPTRESAKETVSLSAYLRGSR